MDLCSDLRIQPTEVFLTKAAPVYGFKQKKLEGNLTAQAFIKSSAADFLCKACLSLAIGC